MPQLILALIVLVLLVCAAFYLLWAVIWVGLIGVITLPACGSAYGIMFAAEHLYCRSKVKMLCERGKLRDMTHLYFKESVLHWQFDEEALAMFVNRVGLKLLLLCVGVVSTWLGLFILNGLGVLQVDVGVSMIGNDHVLSYRINEIIAYLLASVSVGTAFIFLPRSFHRVMAEQAGIHIQRNKDHLESANQAFQGAMKLYEGTVELAIATGDVGLVKALDERHIALHSPNLAEFLKREEWSHFDNHVAAIVADIEGIRQLAENYYTAGVGDGEAEQPPPSCTTEINEVVALQRLGFRSGETPSDPEIKEAFRNLSRIYHPDATLDTEAPQRKRLAELFIQINDAYNFLRERRHF